jgi:hypothetical protein
MPEALLLYPVSLPGSPPMRMQVRSALLAEKTHSFDDQPFNVTNLSWPSILSRQGYGQIST